MNRLFAAGMGGVLFLVFAGMAHAATIQGTVYDGFTLEIVPNAVLSITTSPVQTKVVNNGTYSFEVGPGTYTLRATHSEQGIVIQETNREVNVSGEGAYTIDLILLPNLEEVPNEPLPDELPSIGWIDQLIRGPLPFLGLLGIILLASGYALASIRKQTAPTVHTEKQSSEPREEDIRLDQYATEILGHLKRGGNRTTQKELRGMMKIGEAKVSLIVSELESYGLVKKIKRGRGNILVLTEKGRTKAAHEANEPLPANGKPDPSMPEL